MKGASLFRGEEAVDFSVCGLENTYIFEIEMSPSKSTRSLWNIGRRDKQLPYRSVHIPTIGYDSHATN